MQNIYAEGIGNINIRGNMVKIDFVIQEEGVQTQDQKPVYSISQRVVLPLEGFIQSFNLQENVINALMQRGVLKREEAKSVVGTGEQIKEKMNVTDKEIVLEKSGKFDKKKGNIN